MGKVQVMDHPLIAHKVGMLRRESLGSKEFRAIISEIAMFLCYEATRGLKLRDLSLIHI